MRLSIRDFAALLGVSERMVRTWESRGSDVTLNPTTQAIMDTTLSSRAPEEAKTRFMDIVKASNRSYGQPPPSAIPSDVADIRPAQVADAATVELLRREMQDVLSEGALSNASLEDWEQAVSRHGEATRHRPAGVLLGDLAADIAELKRTLSRCRSASTLRRLNRVAADMAGLMCLTLIKLDDQVAFRGWARVARTAASAAGDPTTESWVLAQEAYGYYYSEDFPAAINVARQAQDVVRRSPSVGAALAAALEARAQAALGLSQETHQALGNAENILERLDDRDKMASAFGYNESQFRFHQSNALTHLRETRAAWHAQERALEVVAPGDYMDRAFTQLDRAMCLAHDGDASAATTYATEILSGLTDLERQGIISLRAWQLLHVLTARQKASPPARDLRDLLITATNEKE